MSCLLAIHVTLPAFFILTVAVWAAEGGAKPDGKIDFQRQIQPLLAKHCYECHGSETQEAGFRLDLRDKALLGGDSGPAIVPGDPAGSQLFDRITATDEDERMPPTWSETSPLAPQAIELFRRWIVEGANWPAAFRAERITSDHWAYQPLGRNAPPEVKNTQWIRNGIDNFVLARLEAAGIDPSEEADRHTLIKRLFYDLIGLPPEPEQVDPFVDDRSPDAYEKLVNRLLASPRFGERWGRHWLDKARFADSDGYEKDNPRPDAWRWRDWVIDAVNRDMPFDEFTVRQLAGDLLPEAGPIDRLATAFHRQTLTNTEGGVDQEEFRVAAVKDRVDTTGAIWLGLTVGCAQCHSHKYDQITQREYYQLFAFFNNGDEATAEVPTSDEATARYEEAKKKHDAKSADLAAKLADRREALSETLPFWEAKLRTKLEAVPEKPVEFPPLEILSAKSDGGATLERLDDGSYLAGGANPDRATYTIIAKSGLGEISGVRLQTLTHDSLPQQGPGRVDHGNFVLSEFRVETSKTEDFKQIAAIEFAGAEADHAQAGWPPTGAIDGRTDTGWAVAPQFGRDHWAVFVAGSPLGSEGTKYLKITLSFQYGSRHTLGRFRLKARAGSKPSDGLPSELVEALAAVPDRRSEGQKRVLLDYSLSQDSVGKKLLQEIAEHEKKEPRRPVVAARVIAQRCTEPRRNFVLNRGDFLQPTIEVSPNTLEVLPPLKPRSPEALPDRLDLAHWVVDPANPLPPRVAVNHLWPIFSAKGSCRRSTISAPAASHPRTRNCWTGLPAALSLPDGAGKK
ncbi:MAG: DUF1549 domain-containing protein [Rhodopirellula sp.]|nr:DUF1549 domain-containing protein [Rhodopirellula sp.]